MRELNSASSNRSRAALHQDGPAFDRTRDMNSPMSGYAGNAETGSLFHWHGFGQGDQLLQRDHCIFGSGPKRAIRLSSITPHTPSDPLLWYVFAHNVDGSSTVAVRNDALIRHSQSKSIFAFFHIAGIHPRRRHANPNFTGDGLWIAHLTDS